MDKINVFIPAAGLGERLRPITDYIPKPLLPVTGRPVLEYVLDKVSSLPFNKIGINLHHMKNAIEKYTCQCSLMEVIEVFPEENILGTGGALKNAGRLLGKRTFLVHNSDVLSDINLMELLGQHDTSNNLATLAVHDYPEFNSLVIEDNGYLKNVSRDAKLYQNEQRLAFTGIAVYEKEFLKYIPDGRSSVVDAWQRAISDGCRVGTYNASGCYWRDVGTPDAYASAVFRTLRFNGETVYFHPSVQGCNRINLQGNVVLEKDCNIGNEVSLKNCILLPDSSIENNHESPLQNCIIGPDFKIDLNESNILSVAEHGGMQLIGTGGSDRKYYRIQKNDKTSVIMKCVEGDHDFERHMAYTTFFRQHSIPVPKLLYSGDDKKEAGFEDAGDISLYSYLKCPRVESEIEDIYRKVISILVQIHTLTEYLDECPLLKERIFDYEYFRWETGYFIERFVENIFNVTVNNNVKLEKDFHDLAARADSYSKTVIHRDFQSQNIMVMKGGELSVLDYQGARVGPPAYDVASILWDPYHWLEDGMKERLLHYYIKCMIEKTAREFDEQLFRESLIVCRLQRHMQALGAYGFLSSVKRNKYFLKYVPEALRLLKQDISHNSDDYPVLSGLIEKLSSRTHPLSF